MPVIDTHNLHAILQHPSWYHAIKIIHIVAVVCWFAGLFYLPRLFVYHASTNNNISCTQFKTMEHKLYWYIMTPAAIITVVSGELLAHVFAFSGTWLHLKVATVGLLVIYHIYCFVLMDNFAKDNNNKSPRYFRVFNEIPTVLLIICVILVIVKP